MQSGIFETALETLGERTVVHYQRFARNKTTKEKYRVLYEWVEDEIDENCFTVVTEVREHAGLLLGDGYGGIAHRIKKFFNLKAVTINGTGRKVKWMPRTV